MFFLILFSLISEGETFKPEKLTFLKIRAPFVRLKFQKTKGPYEIKVQGGKQITFENEQGKASLYSRNYDDKKTWSNKQDPKQAESVITLKGPSVPLAVYSYSANMKVEDWEDSVFVSAQKGEIMALNNQADWQVSLKQGSFVSRNHKGNIKVKGFRLKVFLEKSQGASEESEGLFDFKFNEGSMQVQGGKGKLVFFSDKAPLTLRSFEGSLQANTGSGNILGVLKPKQVEAFSDKGTLNFYFRKQGAKVEASTKGGKMFAPRYFNKKFQGRSVTAKGRLQGFPKEGQVSLRTNTGNIYFY